MCGYNITHVCFITCLIYFSDCQFVLQNCHAVYTFIFQIDFIAYNECYLVIIVTGFVIEKLNVTVRISHTNKISIKCWQWRLQIVIQLFSTVALVIQKVPIWLRMTACNSFSVYGVCFDLIQQTQASVHCSLQRQAFYPQSNNNYCPLDQQKTLLIPTSFYRGLTYQSRCNRT